VLDELRKLGKAAAVPAVLEGLGHGNWQVRRWCAIYLDHDGELASLHLLIPLLRDPKKEVRLWAVHSLSCDRCKEGENPLDVLPLLVERIEVDESIRVRRMATAMLAYGAPDPRAVPVFHTLMERETDEKLRLHASLGLMRCREAGLDAP
jgi:HEAT repeat protein